MGTPTTKSTPLLTITKVEDTDNPFDICLLISVK